MSNAKDNKKPEAKAPAARKELSVKEAQAKADPLKSKQELEKLIISEALDLASGKQHSAQQLLAFGRRWHELDKK